MRERRMGVPNAIIVGNRRTGTGLTQARTRSGGAPYLCLDAKGTHMHVGALEEGETPVIEPLAWDLRYCHWSQRSVASVADDAEGDYVMVFEQ